MNQLKETSLYIHIPFCDHKCIYCDFYSVITSESIDNYLDAIKKEISYYAAIHAKGRIITTVFFGGGTPSLMEPSYLSEILEHIKTYFSLSPVAEITMETNPGTVNKEKLVQFLSTGINRISIGIQSFDPQDLKFLTRIHDPEKAIETVMNARDAGCDNVSIDLIFNLPGQTKEKWMKNLSIAASLPLHHISAYSLILERGTILNKMVLDKKVVLQDVDHDADLYEPTIDYLTDKGFFQYEVSNFAKPGYECLHNKTYWEYKEYIGFGTSSHSFINGKRWWNYSSAKLYISSVNKNMHAEASHEIITNEQKIDEYIMLALRGKGIKLMELINKFDSQWLIRNEDYINNLQQSGHMRLEKQVLKLTPKGYALCDEILLNIR